MKYLLNRTLAIVLPVLLMAATSVYAQAPWGSAELMQIKYAPQKAVYDVSVSTADELSNVIDRVSYLNNIYNADPFEASIVVVLHGDEIPMFAIKNFDRSEDVMRRAQSLTIAGPVEFRMCVVAARAHGLEPDEIHGFVNMIPMADAEIIRLQQEEGYVYMR